MDKLFVMLKDYFQIALVMEHLKREQKTLIPSQVTTEDATDLILEKQKYGEWDKNRQSIGTPWAPLTSHQSVCIEVKSSSKDDLCI